jgi:CheY-like chemotaxis protein
MIHDRPSTLTFQVVTASEPVTDRKPRDVLIVDDNRDLVEVVIVVLENDGYTCRRAENGQQALEMIASTRPALVLLDLDMPVMNGSECGRLLRATYGISLPIVIMSASRQGPDAGDQIGAVAVLCKPFDIGQLRRTVARYAGDPVRLARG